MRVRQRQQLQQLRIVVQHLLEMRHQPEGVGGISGITAAEVIVDAALRHAVEHQVQRLLPLGRAGAERVLPQEPENRRVGEFRRALQPAVLRIVQPQQRRRDRIQMHRRRQVARIGGRHPGQHLAQRGGVLRHHLVVGAVCLRHARSTWRNDGRPQRGSGGK